jgi:ATP-binding cassette subfamily B protein
MSADTHEEGTDGDADWRGIASEDEEADAVDRRTGLRLQARARRLVAELLRPHRGAVVLAAVLLVAENAAMLVGPLMVALAIDTGVPAAVDGRPGPLAAAIGGYAAVAVAGAALRSAFLLLSGRIGQDLLLDVRRRLFAHAQRLSLGFHESFTSGRLISRLTSDVDALSDLLEKGLDGLFGAILSLVGITVLLVWIDPLLAAVVLAGFVPLVLLTRWFQRRSRASYRRTRTTVARVIVHFVESVNGIRAVQAFRREPRNDEIMHGLTAANRDANTAAFLTVAWYVATVRLVGNGTLAVVLLLGGLRVVDGTLALGALIAFVLYLRRFYDPLDDLAQFFNAYQSAAAALEKIAAVLDTPVGVPEPARPVPLPRPVRGELEFDRVRFAYERAPDHTVLPEFSLHVPAGQTVALVGATGAGKSTVAKLVARFYDPTAGTVRLDGVDLRELSDDDRLGGRQHRDGPARRRRAASGRGRRRRRGRGRPRVRRCAAGGLRHRRPQARRTVVGRSAPARRAGAGTARRSGRRAARRGHVLAGHPVRTCRAGRPGAGARRPDRADHRPPPLDGADRRPGAGGVRRPDRAGRIPRGPAGRGGRVRRAPRGVARQRGLMCATRRPPCSSGRRGPPPPP